MQWTRERTLDDISVGSGSNGRTTTKDAAVKGNPLSYIEQNSAKVRSGSKRWVTELWFRE